VLFRSAAFISSGWDRSGRQAYFEELSRWMPIDSYGRFMRNRTMPSDQGAASKIETISRYKFTLAFENALGMDYVTEKFFDPLVAGSVPVYLGAPNIDDFAPGERCCINARDFPEPSQLASHLLRLGADDAAYGGYLDWKAQPYRDTFRELLALGNSHPFVRLCARLRERMAR
jgi:hypothetical protein